MEPDACVCVTLDAPDPPPDPRLFRDNAHQRQTGPERWDSHPHQDKIVRQWRRLEALMEAWNHPACECEFCFHLYLCLHTGSIPHRLLKEMLEHLPVG